MEVDRSLSRAYGCSMVAYSAILGRLVLLHDCCGGISTTTNMMNHDDVIAPNNGFSVEK